MINMKTGKKTKHKYSGDRVKAMKRRIKKLVDALDDIESRTSEKISLDSGSVDVIHQIVIDALWRKYP